jgi:hypothetical protein
MGPPEAQFVPLPIGFARAPIAARNREDSRSYDYIRLDYVSGSSLLVFVQVSPHLPYSTRRISLIWHTVEEHGVEPGGDRARRTR